MTTLTIVLNVVGCPERGCPQWELWWQLHAGDRHIYILHKIVPKTYSKLLITTVCPGKGKTLHCNLLVQVVQDSVQELLLLVPQIKSNISDAIAMVPEVNAFFDNSSLQKEHAWWNYCIRWRVSWRRSWTSCQRRRSCRRRRIISSPSCQTIRWEHHHMNLNHVSCCE